jgi:hypothetical protein
MSAIMEAFASGSGRFDDGPFGEITELGRKALRKKQSDELAFDLLALDGVRLPLDSMPHPRLTAQVSRLGCPHQGRREG